MGEGDAKAPVVELQLLLADLLLAAECVVGMPHIAGAHFAVLPFSLSPLPFFSVFFQTVYVSPLFDSLSPLLFLSSRCLGTVPGAPYCMEREATGIIIHLSF